MSDQQPKEVKFYTQQDVDNIMEKVKITTKKEVENAIKKEFETNLKKQEIKKIYNKLGKKEYFEDFLKLNEDLLNSQDVEKDIEKKIEKSLYKKEVEPKDDFQKIILEPDKNSKIEKEVDPLDLSEFFVPNK